MNRVNINSFIVACSILVAGCCNDNQVGSIDFDSFAQAELSPMAICCDLVAPQSLFLVERSLLITDKYDEKLVTVVPLDSLDASRRIINYGNGPHEFLKISSIWGNSDRGFCEINDDFRRSVSRYLLTDDLCLSDDTFVDSDSYSGLADVLSLAPLPCGHIATGGFSDGLFCYYDEDFDVKQVFGPAPENDGALSKVFAMKHQGTVTCSPDGKFLAFGEMYSDAISFYERKGDTFDLVRTYGSYDPDVDIISQSVNGTEYVAVMESDNSIRGYRDICAAGECFYALYWGVPVNMVSESNNCCFIIRFSSEGKVEGGYRFDRLLRSAVIDPSSMTLYALSFSVEGNDELLRCQL